MLKAAIDDSQNMNRSMYCQWQRTEPFPVHPKNRVERRSTVDIGKCSDRRLKYVICAIVAFYEVARTYGITELVVVDVYR